MFRKLFGIFFLIGAIGIPLSTAGTKNWVFGLSVGVFYLIVAIMFFAYSAMIDKKWWQKAIYVIVCLAIALVLAPTAVIIGGAESVAREKGIPSSQIYSQLKDEFIAAKNKTASQQ